MKIKLVIILKPPKNKLKMVKYTINNKSYYMSTNIYDMYALAQQPNSHKNHRFWICKNIDYFKKIYHERWYVG